MTIIIKYFTWYTNKIFIKIDMVKKAQSGNQKQKNKPFKGSGISKNKKFVMGSSSKQNQKHEKL